MDLASAIILAGGKSSRMGLPKATLPLGPTTIIERLISELGRVFSEVTIVAAPEADEPFSLSRLIKSHSYLKLVRDQVAFKGPVGALRQGMLHARGDVVFACSCDLPLLRGEIARELCAIIGEHDCAIPDIAGRLQPLCAGYRRVRCADALGLLEAAGEQRLTAIAERVNTRRVGEAELRRFDPDLRSFINVNTADDYARALRSLRETTDG